MTLKTKDILKILKLVKKSKKNKKRKRRNKKVIVATQQIKPSTLQPYEISRIAPPQNTIQLDNMRLNNQMLENNLIEYNKNKAKESDDTFKNIENSINLSTSSISDIRNKNMDLNNRLNKVIDFGNKFVNQTNRKFDNNELKLNDIQSAKINTRDVFNNPDDYFVDTNPLHIIKTEQTSLDDIVPTSHLNTIEQEPIGLNEHTSGVSEFKDEQPVVGFDIAPTTSSPTSTEVIPAESKAPMSPIINKPIVKKMHKKITNEKIKKGEELLKQIESETGSRDLTADEKSIFQQYSKVKGLTWGNRTTKSKNALQKLKPTT